MAQQSCLAESLPSPSPRSLALRLGGPVLASASLQSTQDPRESRRRLWARGVRAGF